MTAPTLSLDDLRGDRRRTAANRRARNVFLAMAVLSIVISALIVYSLLGEAWSFITKVEPSALWSEGWFPRFGDFDIKTLFVGSLIVTLVAMVVAAPVGLGVAVYLSEYASPRVRRVLKPTMEILAGIPSVVLGFFALTYISPEIIQNLFSDATQSNLLAAGLGVGILTIPLIASISEDAMRSVPMALREASYGMGARKALTVRKVVLPAAISGLVAAFIIGISRALGETMVVTIAAGGAGGSAFTTDPLGPGLTMTAAMATQARGTDAVAVAGDTNLVFPSLFFVGLLLFLFTLALNLLAGRIVRRVREVY